MIRRKFDIHYQLDDLHLAALVLVLDIGYPLQKMLKDQSKGKLHF